MARLKTITKPLVLTVPTVAGEIERLKSWIERHALLLTFKQQDLRHSQWQDTTAARESLQLATSLGHARRALAVLLVSLAPKKGDR